EFTRLKSGGKFTVKVPGINVISAFVYGNFENPKIYSFVAENESERTAKGFPVENLTPFDKAFRYYKDQSEDWQDEMSAKANVYKADQKFTFGFYDLDGEDEKGNPKVTPIAFEVSKTGTGRNTMVNLSLIPMLDELTDKQRENFENAPSDFDAKNFEGLYYVMDDDEQIEKLIEVGFDVSLIGLESPKKDDEQ